MKTRERIDRVIWYSWNRIQFCEHILCTKIACPRSLDILNVLKQDCEWAGVLSWKTVDGRYVPTYDSVLPYIRGIIFRNESLAETIILLLLEWGPLLGDLNHTIYLNEMVFTELYMWVLKLEVSTTVIIIVSAAFKYLLDIRWILWVFDRQCEVDKYTMVS